jgi:hypothetical protein
MATNNTPIVSIFDERGSAERAIEDLYNAGIPSDQISYSGGSTPTTSEGGFLGSIKSLFTGGHDRTSNDVLNDLNNMGIPQDEAAYYAQQYDAGRTIVAIQQETPHQNALTILRSNGGYDYQGNWNKASADKFADKPGDTTSSDNPAPDRNFAGTEAGTYDQSPTTPAFTSQRRYAENTDTSNSPNQDLTNSGSPYPQNSINSANTYNQGIDAPQNQLRNSPDQRIRTEHDEVNSNPDQTYEREQRNTTNQNNV